MVNAKMRWDFVGLSTDNKPTPDTSPKVVDGSTYYCSDTSKLYVFCRNNWYERKPLGGGGGGTSYTAGDGITIADDTISVDTTTIQEKLTAGTGIDITDNTISATGGGGPTVVQTMGTSTTDVMSQNATTSMVFADPNTQRKIKIGAGTSSSEGTDGIEIGYNAAAKAEGTVCIGVNTLSDANTVHSVVVGERAYVKRDVQNAVALGYGAEPTRSGEVYIGCPSYNGGFGGGHYRVRGGVHDGQDLHDAATLAQGNTLSTSAPTTSTVGVLGQLYTDTTNMHTYQLTAISGDTYTWTQRW